MIRVGDEVGKVRLRTRLLFWKSWVEEGVDTVGNGVLLLFAEDKTL